MPTGTATIRDINVMVTVLIKAGSSEAFSLVYFNSKREGFGTESEIYLATLAFLNLFLFIFVLVN